MKLGNRRNRAMLLVGIAVGSAASAEAQTFFGLDNRGSSENSRPTSFTNSFNARGAFLSMLAGVGTESFEGFSTGSFPNGTSLTFPGAGTATFSSSNLMEIRADAPPGGTNGVGRYPISGTKYLVANAGSFTIDFGSPVAAFGFFGVDVGDFGSQLSLTFIRSGGSNTVINPAHATTFATAAGSAFFFGHINAADPFNAVQFSVVGGSDDFFAFDDMTLGSRGQVTGVVPEPMSMVLLGTGLAGVAAARRRRRKQYEV